MTRHSRLFAGLAVAALLFAACGGSDDDTGGAGGENGQTLKIGLIAPLTGDLSALGLGIRNGAELAIRQANKANKIPGYTLELAPEDDTAKADVGAQVAAKLASDDEIVAVIGTLNSSVAEQVQPVLADEGIAMVSPANTNPTLSQGADPAKPERPYANYFRVATTDLIQGPFAADFATKDIKATEVAVVHDNKTYGKGLSEAFAKRFKANGGKVVLNETVNPGDKDFGAVVSRVRGAKPDLVYYGGEFPEASLLSSQLDQAGVEAPLMGGDGIFDATFFETGGKGTLGDFATSIGAPLEDLETAKDFLAAYDKAGFDEDPSAYGGYAYDAASVIITALEEAVGEAGEGANVTALREDLVAAIQGTSIDGVTGKVAFDEFGDTTTKVLTVYTVSQDCAPEADEGDDDTTTTAAAARGDSGALCWKPEKTDEFE
jgi:branched-chain amino acid transport system substrate-binding protein